MRGRRIVKATSPFSSLRVRLVGTVFLAIAPAGVLMYAFDLPWMGFVMGLLALAAAWFGGERFILRQVRVLLTATERLAAGDLSSRTGLGNAKGELGQLAHTFDEMAKSLEERAREREEADRILLNRALQQTVVAALGQFALTTNDLSSLLDQATMFVAQTLDVDYCHVFELLPGGDKLRLAAGAGWKPECVGSVTVESGRENQVGLTLAGGDPVVVNDWRNEKRIQPLSLYTDHGVLSGLCVVIATRQQPFGVLGACSTRAREYNGDDVHFLLAVATELGLVAERNRTEAQLQKLAAFAKLYPGAAMELTAEGEVSYFNDAALRLALSVERPHPRAVLPPNIQSVVQDCLTTNQSKRGLETKVEGRTFSWSFHPVPASQIVHCYVEDITDRLSLEAQLRQSQKMDSVGQLAAGVAHDFNNMLTIIQGHSSMMMSKANLPPDQQDSARAVYFASERAASLTRQLLMFSRKNIMQPKALDLRDVIGNLSKMLKRLLGETVTLDFNPPPDLPLVHADAGMMEQVIMNLSVNARDAMPKGGTLTLSVEPVEVDIAYAQTHTEARVGLYVRLRAADTGTGMEPGTISRIFEPFFTTKEAGKGTGLGLATVYGIVKQHNGWIEVASEVGKGSTFSVFIPASGESARAVKEGTDPAAFVRGGKETILIVEDESVLRDMAHLILEECGYRLLDAGSGREAINVWNKHQDKVDLLLTDMVMPEGMSGVELAETLLASRPRLKIVFTSGYTVGDMSREFLARNNALFLQKPYTRASLARTVRQALDAAPK